MLSQLHGASGLAVIQAILNGERDAHKLLSLCHHSIIRKKADQILKALEGHYTESGLFALNQAYKGYIFYKEQIRACDHALQKSMEQINNYLDDQDSKKQIDSVKGRKPIRHNKPEVEHLGGHLMKIFTGKDATVLPGITDYTWMQLYAETGNDLSRWKSEKHYTAWLGLAPGQHNSRKAKENKKSKIQTESRSNIQANRSEFNRKQENWLFYTGD